MRSWHYQAFLMLVMQLHMDEKSRLADHISARRDFLILYISDAALTHPVIFNHHKYPGNCVSHLLPYIRQRCPD